MILETIVTTRTESGADHIAPMGLREQDGYTILSPFRPSATLDHILREQCAIVNLTDDVRVFAGCLTGRYGWPTVPGIHLACNRLAATLAHVELELDHVEDDPVRPRLWCRTIERFNHAPFPGFNRAQAAVIEAAILVSRLGMLPAEKVSSELDYLEIAVEKTAGPREREAWDWLQAAVAAHRDGRKESAA
jgi:uncharacterized protein